MSRILPWCLTLILLACTQKRPQAAAELSLLNVSYDPTRELYDDYNRAFAKHWADQRGQRVTVKQSHGGSGKQARAVIDGLEADVVTLALEYDVNSISRQGLIEPNWRARLSGNSAPYTSIIVFVVRAGNPKNIRDWNDLARSGISVITPNPKTGGGARLNYLGAWAYGLKTFAQNEDKTREFLSSIYKNVPVLDSGARGSSTTFIERGIGDVLISWENEALMALGTFGKDRFEVVVPSLTILAEPSVAVVDRYATKHGTQEIARDYLQYLYANEGQELIAKHHFRPRDPAVLARHQDQFAKTELVSVNDLGDWDGIQKKHFADHGTFDRIYDKPQP
ncbi:MAG: sulfate ABC transporter substrate-binding protein [Polyangiaceae bacterium]